MTAYIESATGVAEGGRTGLTAVVAGLLLAVAIFLPPLAVAVPAAATASIGTGLALGFVSCPVVKLLAGRAREVGPLVDLLTVLFVLRFAYPGAG